MPTFADILTSTPEDLLRYFCRVVPATEGDIFVKINTVAKQMGLTHGQLVCGLGFNLAAQDLEEIVSLLGFSSFRLLGFRRSELFTTDFYADLPIDSLLDLYGEANANPGLMDMVRDHIPKRLENLDRRIVTTADPTILVSYRMEIHAMYNGGIITPFFCLARLGMTNGAARVHGGEAIMAVNKGFIQAENLLFMESIALGEKEALLTEGLIDKTTVATRLASPNLTADERALLERFA
jgi:hypothetical protein